jgi:hemerythrin-like domain-containing protein
MITYEELHTQNHTITELSNVLLCLFKERTMCENGACCELFSRYVDKVKAHIDLVDKNLYSKLLTNDDHEAQKLARNFMSGSQEIRRIMTEHRKEWCPKKNGGSLTVADHASFLKDTEKMFELILERIQDETEKLYPMIRELNGNHEHAAQNRL